VYAAVQKRALAACADDRYAAERFDELELHSELADVYDRMGRVEDALRHADVLAERGYACRPDPRCRRAEILMRHGRVTEAAVIWERVARETPDDVWVFNNAGLEYGALGDHEAALPWLTSGLELAVGTGDPERLVGQLRDARAASLAALGREPDALRAAEPVPGTRAGLPPLFDKPMATGREIATGYRDFGNAPVVWAWLPQDEFGSFAERWPDIAASEIVLGGRGGIVTHAEYSRRMEQRLRSARDEGVTRIRIAPVRWAEFSAWCEQTGDEDAAQLRARYAAHLGRDPSRVIAWPPGRNEPCWCGSGRKYKKCCAAPGQGETL
jgi:tetratricopeptide (TPR) repeat protein